MEKKSEEEDLLSILLVDSNLSLCELLRERLLLASSSFLVHIKSNPIEAFAFLEVTSVDLVVSAIEFDDVDSGFWLAEQVADFFPSVEFVFFAGCSAEKISKVRHSGIQLFNKAAGDIDLLLSHIEKRFVA